MDPDSGARSAALDAKAAMASLRPLVAEKDMPDGVGWPDSFDRAGRVALYALGGDLYLLDLASSRFERLTRVPEREADR